MPTRPGHALFDALDILADAGAPPEVWDRGVRLLAASGAEWVSIGTAARAPGSTACT